MAALIQLGNLRFEQIAARFRALQPVPLLLGLACFGLYALLGAVRYRLFLPPEIRVSYLAGVSLFQNAILMFLPWRIGEVGYPLALQMDYQQPVAKTISTVIAIRMVDVAILLSAALAGSGWLGFSFQAVAISLGALLISALILGMIGSKSVVAPRLRGMLSAFVVLREKPLHLLILSVLLFLISSLQSMLIFQAVNYPLAYLHIAWINALSILSSILPIHPPAGLGTMDSFQTVILFRLGYDQTSAASSVLAVHVLYLLFHFIGGVTGWLLRKKKA